MATQRYNIDEVPNEFDDHLLDLIGATFNFDHVKGLSEWLKNSVDAYRRAGLPDREQSVFFRFTDGKKNDSTVECIDFNGMTSNDIEKALKRWGDPEAAKRGIKNLKTFGGHGNGGKFYMRQMFTRSHYVTYKDGLLNVFGFSENKKYGFAHGFRNKKVSPREALQFANLDKGYISKELTNKVLEGKTGFTVTKGIGPATMPNVIKVGFIINHLVSHPQSQRILAHIPSKVIYNESIFANKLETEKIVPLPGFETIEPIQIPEKLVYETHHDRVEIEMANAKYPPGKLRLSTSEQPMARGSKYGELNRIDVIGELGVIGSYKLHELGNVTFMPQYAFIYGELECPILEEPSQDSVQNDRTKLIENPTTKALLEWVSEQVVVLCKKIADKERAEREEKMKDISSTLNSFLNQWKDKFMSKILAEVLAGEGPLPGIGRGGLGGNGGHGGGKGGGGGDGGGSGNSDDGGGDTPKKTKRSPKVLLSGQDPDPFEPHEPISLTPRHPTVYQRPKDYIEGVYWINTSAPLANGILERYDQNHPRWRDYLFQRYVDIFVKEALTSLEKRDPDEFNAANVDVATSEVVQKIHQAAAEELGSFLFEDTFNAQE